MSRYLLLFILVSLVTACTETEDPILPRPTTTVDFRNPVVGQQNTYSSYNFRCGAAERTPGSELMLTVTAVTESLLELTETTTDTALAPIVLHAERVPGNLIISAEERSRSNLLFFYGSDSIRLDAPAVASLDYRDCVFYDNDQVFTGDYVASIDEFLFEDQRMTNLKTVSCVPIVLDLDAYLLYTENNLVASIQTWRDFGNEGNTTVYLLQTE
ncbi:MAG: hypothetical protein AAF597_10980 [Bacteroidota bacterium]